MVPALGGELCPDMEGLWGDDDEAEAVATAKLLLGKGALSVSAEEEINVDKLLSHVTDTLIQHRKTLNNDDFGAFDPGF